MLILIYKIGFLQQYLRHERMSYKRIMFLRHTKRIFFISYIFFVQQQSHNFLIGKIKTIS